MCFIFSGRNFIGGVVLAALAVIGCADERRNHPVFLDDLNDVDRFPSDDRRQLRAEHDNLPRSLMVRVPVNAKGEPRTDARAEVRHFDQDLGKEKLSGERMAAVWHEGRSSDRARLAHNLRHIAKDHEYGRSYSTQHDIDGYSDGHYGKHRYYRHGYRHGYKHGHRYHGHGRYRGHLYNRGALIHGYGNSYLTTYWRSYYRPYYRSSYYPNLWWGNYRFYNTYYQPRGYRYFVYCPNTYYRTYTSIY